MTIPLEEALTKVKEHIIKVCKLPQEYTVDIHMWERNEWIGVHVSEVSISTTNRGTSWMQADKPHGLAVCAQVERVLLAYVDDTDDPAYELDGLDTLIIA